MAMLREHLNSDIFLDTVKRKPLAIVGAAVIAVLIICTVVWITPLALVRSWTDVVGDVPSPGGKWDVVLIVRNAGATTDYSTQLSIIPAGGRLSREIALCRPGNVFIADGNDGAVAVNDKGFMPCRYRLAIAQSRSNQVPLQRPRVQKETQVRVGYS
jgi:hypothetical protein